MRTKVTLVLIFLNVALFFFIFKFERNWRTEAASLEARRRVLGPEAASIRTLEVTSAVPGGDFTLVRQRDGWLLTKPFEWPANPHAANAIVNQLALLEHETSFSTRDLGKNNNPTLADYGLDKPRLTVAFTPGDATAGNAPPTAPTILRIGDTTKVGNRLYVLSPDGQRIHVVNRSLVDSLTLPLAQLRADKLLTVEVFQAASLSIQSVRGSAAATARVRIRKEGTRWMFETPIIARASKTAIEGTVNQLNALHAKTFAATPPDTLPSAAPALRLGLEGNNYHETLFVGDPVPATPGAPAAPAAAGTEYFAQLEGRPAVFTVVLPPGLLATLTDATSALRERHILDFVDPLAVTSITIEDPSQSVTLQRLDPSATAADAGAWQIVRRDDRQPGVQASPADRTAVYRLLNQLLQLQAQTFADNPTNADLENWGFNRPERIVTLSFAPAAPAAAGQVTGPSPAATTPPVVLRFGTDASRKVFARVGTPTGTASPTVYGLDIDLREHFPLESIAWRDRTLPIVPANARIAAVKIVNLANGETAFATSFDAAGQPPADAPQLAAVQEIVAQLRRFRVRRFRPETFTADRPWQYRLEVALVLPGSAAGEQAETKTLFLAGRTGGAEQIAGSGEFNAVFELEQSLVDQLWTILYGPRDPGPAAPPPPVDNRNAKEPDPR